MYKGRIVNGYSADDYQFPYQASLRDSVSGKHFCGAFVLTERWLGTAGENIGNCFVIRMNARFFL